FSAIIGIILLFSKQRVYRGGKILASAILVNMWLLGCDTLTWYTDGSTNMWGAVLVRLSNYSVFALEFVLLMIITEYIYNIVKDVNPEYSDRNRKIVIGLMGADLLLLASNPLTHLFFSIDAQNVYHRSGTFWISMTLAFLAFVVCAIILKDNWKLLERNSKAEIILFLVCPLIGALIQLFVYGISFINFGITISVFAAYGAYMVRLNKWRKANELQLLQSQTYMLSSQIKPHFLFNSLNVIQDLIEEDPDTAIVAVNRFSKYLRTGLKIESMDSMVPLKTEMEFVDNYLYLEKLRHGERIKVVKNIEPDLNFKIPFLTIQPLVENAVRHGICKKIKGGTITIAIYRIKDGYEITIEDDGVGYLPIENEEKEWNPEDGASTGVGTTNVRKRLSMMCNGTMEIDSEPGKGTKVIIRIPGKR
ncbi:MAG: histidine kinase, partial [Lachnospiraceae bacterium]|nr:histidine kinase [Lachnospiraceae bacterium]